MDAIISQRLNYLVETYQLLLPTYIGGRKKRSTEHALHAVTEKIYKAWNRKRTRVASLLLLDVSGAFDNVSYVRLLHNLRKRKIDEKTVRWIASFLGNRHTHQDRRLHIHAVREKHGHTPGLSAVAYPLPVLQCRPHRNVPAGSERSSNRIHRRHSNPGMGRNDGGDVRHSRQIAQQWASTHASVFAPDKFQLTHFTRTRKKIDVNRPIQSIWGEIKPNPTCKYLGLTMDTKLTWKPHIEEIRQKATKTVHALSNLGNSKWGASLIELRKIYEGTAVPQMMYACSIWTNENGKKQTYTKKALDILQSI